MRIDIYCIYIHRNKINGKMYIGQTCQKPEERWRNGKGYRKGTFFRKAIDKYGWDNFTHEIVYDNLTLEEANLYEQWLIYLGNTTNENYGYNLTDGGDGSKGYKHTDESKEKISKIHKGKKISEEQKMALIETNRGNKYMLGKHHTEDAKEKISKKNSKSVICVETGFIYSGTRDAERQTGINHSSISLNISGKYENAGGYHWKRYNAS